MKWRSLRNRILVACLISVARPSDAEWTLRNLSHPSLVDRVPGPDLLIGTSDDAFVPGSNPLGLSSYSVFVPAPPATPSYLGLDGQVRFLDPLFGSAGFESRLFEFAPPAAFAETTLRITDREPRVTRATPGGLVSAQYTVETCRPGVGCYEADGNLLGGLIHNAPGLDDPLAIPGLPAVLAQYLAAMKALLPDGWTSAAVMLWPPTLVTEANTRGALAPLLYGGTIGSIAVFWSTDPLPASVFGSSDADADGVTDALDNCTNQANVTQIDADRDGFGNACDADFDQNGIVNFSDLSRLKASFLTADGLPDLDANGIVNFGDLARFKARFLEPPGPKCSRCPLLPCSGSGCPAVTLSKHPGDPILATVLTVEGPTVEYRGERDLAGLPTRIVGFRVHASTGDVTEIDVDSLGRPTRLVGPDGAIVPLVESFAAGAFSPSLGPSITPEPALAAGAPGDLTAPSTVSVQQCDRPAQNLVVNLEVRAPLPSTELPRTYAAAGAGPGVWKASIPLPPPYEVDADDQCRRFADSLERTCLPLQGALAGGAALCLRLPPLLAQRCLALIGSEAVAGAELVCGSLGAGAVEGAPSLAEGVCPIVKSYVEWTTSGPLSFQPELVVPDLGRVGAGRIPAQLAPASGPFPAFSLDLDDIVGDESCCGNGVVDNGGAETCDDGNTASGDGCDARCRIEPGCGDGELQSGEQCDDANRLSGDGCSSLCEHEICGDGVRVGIEECDDAGVVRGDGCNHVCGIERRLPLGPNVLYTTSPDFDLLSAGYVAGDVLLIRRTGGFSYAEDLPDNTATALSCRFATGGSFVGSEVFLPGSGAEVTVPLGALTLRFSVSDPFVDDNTDENGDFGAIIERLATSPRDSR